MFRGAQRRAFLNNSADASAERRMEDRLDLRRQQRTQGLQKRRKQQEQGADGNDWETDINNLDPQIQNRLRNLHLMAEVLRNGSQDEKTNTVEQIRKLLSIEKTPPIQSVINAGMVEILMEIMSNKQNNMRLRFEAAWALTNVASGSSNHTKHVVDANGVEAFVQIIASETGDIKEQAVWALGNIAGDCAELRDRVLRAGALNYLLQIFVDEQQNRGFLRNATWTLSNFCRGKPHADFETLRPCLQLLVNLLTVKDDEILQDTCWAISYISDDPTPTNCRIQEVIDMGFVPLLINLLDHTNTLVVHPALRAIGNIVTGNDTQTQTVIGEGVLPKLKNLLNADKQAIRKEACWTISNITAGNVHQIEEVSRAQLIPPVLQALGSSVFEIRKEACWAISNATAGGSADQIKYMVQCGAIKPLIDVVNYQNPKTLRVALEGLENILKIGAESVRDDQQNPYVAYIEEYRGFELISRHESNGMNPGIVEKVRRIMSYAPNRIQAGKGLAI